MLVGFDTETYLIGPDQYPPKVVCLTTVLDGDPNGEDLVTPYCEEYTETTTTLLRECEGVACNLSFDLTVLMKQDPALLPDIFDALEAGRLHDVIIREKLLNLATHGKLADIPLPSGATKRMDYSLAELALKYLGVDLRQDKGSDSWRMSYQSLDGVHPANWPEKAISYAVDDSRYALEIFKIQAARAKDLPTDPFKVEAFRTRVDFILTLLSIEGVCIDPEEKKEVEALLEKELRPEKLNLLIESGILRPAEPEKPYKNKAKAHEESCDKKKGCDCPLKMKAAKKESVNRKRYQEFVEELALKHEIEFKYTDKGNKSLDADFLTEYAHLSPVLLQMEHRQKLQKIVTTELPRMEWGGVVAKKIHPNYDVLKETGRTSSFGGSLYPSGNIQNVDPRVRQCYVARDLPKNGLVPEWAILSIDYSQMELGTLAQCCLNLFGYSVLAELINNGVDVHAYLGAQLAKALDPEFQNLVRNLAQPLDVYEEFRALKDSDSEDERAFYKHWRKFAKPTGLGYPGGLGARTFITYARGTYDVQVDLETAKALKDIWLETYPEMVDYFRHINRDLKDPWNQDRYAYETTFGMLRRGATYCAAANGLGLQAFAAEGALLGLYEVGRASHDVRLGSVLFDNFKPWGFVHDEILGDVRLALAHECYEAAADLMIKSMRKVTPDVACRVEPALMLKWNKFADPVYDEEGRLALWPKNSLRAST